MVRAYRAHPLQTGKFKPHALLCTSFLKLPKTFGLTARNPKKAELTAQNFLKNGINFNKDIFNFSDLSINYHKGVFYSPDIDDKSTKLETIGKVVKFLKEMKQEIGRIIFIDNEERHLKNESTEKLLEENKNIDFFFFNYQRTYEPFHSFCTSEAPDLSQLKFIEHKDSSGGGGVYVFEDENHKKWTIKSWQKRKHGYNECLGSEVYSRIGGLTAGFYTYDDLPINLKNSMKGGTWDAKSIAFYRIAEYIDGETPSKQFLQDNFSTILLPISFVSNWDIKYFNFIKKDEKIYPIDFGSAFDSHGFGHDKKENEEWYPSQISELSTFFKYKEKYVQKITPTVLYNIIKEFDFKKEEVVKAITDFCDHSYYDHKRKWISFVEDRYNHLQLLKNLQNKRFNTKADPFQKGSSRDAAGAIIYCVINGETHFLVEKRRGNKLWEFGFGGKVDLKDDSPEYLYEAGYRELEEESGHSFSIGDHIFECPSHDLLRLENDILVSRYRAYLVKIKKPINPKTDGEHTEFQWIPVEDVQEAFKKKNITKIDEKETIEIDGKILFPPSYELFCQDQVQGWMDTLLKGEEIPVTCTQSLFGMDSSFELFAEDITTQQSDRLRFTYAMNLLNQDRYFRNKENKQEQKNNTENEISKPTVKTASRSLLEHLDKSHISNNNFQTQDESDLETIKRVMSALNIDDEQAKFFLMLLKEEEKNSSKEVLYHGLKKELLFCLQVLNVILSNLNGRETKLTQLRSTDHFFNQFPTIWHLFQYIENGNNNYSSGYKGAGVSCSPGFPSNTEVDTSCTARYFLDDDSRKAPDIWSVLSIFLQELNLPHQLMIRELQNVYKETLSQQKTGGLIQFFIDPKITNKVTYPSGNMGSTITKIDSSEKVQNSQEVFKAFKSDEKFPYDINKENLQFRLHAGLEQFSDSLETKFYYSCKDENLTSKVEKKILFLLNKYLFSIVEGSLYSSVYHISTPSLSQIIRHKENISSYELQEGDDPIVHDIKGGNYTSLINLYFQDPENFSFSYMDKDNLEDIKFEKLIFDKYKQTFQQEELTYINKHIIGNAKFINYSFFEDILEKLTTHKEAVIFLIRKNFFALNFKEKCSAEEIKDTLRSTNNVISRKNEWIIDLCLKHFGDKFKINSSIFYSLSDLGEESANKLVSFAVEKKLFINQAGEWIADHTARILSFCQKRIKKEELLLGVVDLASQYFVGKTIITSKLLEFIYDFKDQKAVENLISFAIDKNLFLDKEGEWISEDLMLNMLSMIKQFKEKDALWVLEVASQYFFGKTDINFNLLQNIYWLKNHETAKELISLAFDKKFFLDKKARWVSEDIMLETLNMMMQLREKNGLWATDLASTYFVGKMTVTSSILQTIYNLEEKKIANPLLYLAFDKKLFLDEEGKWVSEVLMLNTLDALKQLNEQDALWVIGLAKKFFAGKTTITSDILKAIYDLENQETAKKLISLGFDKKLFLNEEGKWISPDEIVEILNMIQEFSKNDQLWVVDLASEYFAGKIAVTSNILRAICDLKEQEIAKQLLSLSFDKKLFLDEEGKWIFQEEMIEILDVIREFSKNDQLWVVDLAVEYFTGKTAITCDILRAICKLKDEKNAKRLIPLAFDKKLFLDEEGKWISQNGMIEILDVIRQLAKMDRLWVVDLASRYFVGKVMLDLEVLVTINSFEQEEHAQKIIPLMIEKELLDFCSKTQVIAVLDTFAQKIDPLDWEWVINSASLFVPKVTINYDILEMICFLGEQSSQKILPIAVEKNLFRGNKKEEKWDLEHILNILDSFRVIPAESDHEWVLNLILQYLIESIPVNNHIVEMIYKCGDQESAEKLIKLAIEKKLFFNEKNEWVDSIVGEILDILKQLNDNDGLWAVDLVSQNFSGKIMIDFDLLSLIYNLKQESAEQIIMSSLKDGLFLDTETNVLSPEIIKNILGAFNKISPNDREWVLNLTSKHLTGKCTVNHVMLENMATLGKEFSEKYIPFFIEKNFFIDERGEKMGSYSVTQTLKALKEIKETDREWVVDLAAQLAGKICISGDVLSNINDLGKVCSHQLISVGIQNNLFLNENGEWDQTHVGKILEHSAKAKKDNGEWIFDLFLKYSLERNKIDTDVLETLSFLGKKFSEKLLPLALEKNIIIEDKYSYNTEFSFKEVKEFFDDKYNKVNSKDRSWILDLASEFVGKITSEEFVSSYGVAHILHYIAPLGKEVAEKLIPWGIKRNCFIDKKNEEKFSYGAIGSMLKYTFSDIVQKKNAYWVFEIASQIPEHIFIDDTMLYCIHRLGKENAQHLISIGIKNNFFLKERYDSYTITKIFEALNKMDKNKREWVAELIGKYRDKFWIDVLLEEISSFDNQKTASETFSFAMDNKLLTNEKGEWCTFKMREILKWIKETEVKERTWVANFVQNHFFGKTKIDCYLLTVISKMKNKLGQTFVEKR